MTAVAWYDVPLLVLVCHFIGDFAFQSAWMAAEKGKKVEVLLYHCATYTAPFALTLVLIRWLTDLEPNILWCVSAIFLTHVLIDTLSARLHIIKTIWCDQLCHAVVLTLIFVGLL